VSFTKGCFVGQELVCRIDSRGHVNRHLRRLRSNGGKIQPGDAVSFEGKEVGEVTSASGPVALAMLRREVEPGATVTVGAVGAAVEAL
jgi:tRNA-modifying protein YgfZ